ncbi:MAG: family 78 glycoside hydrolase catalytic domain [Lactovum sp.]
MKISQLTCEYKKNPLGIDKKNPRISWKLNSKHRGIIQTAYQVQVSTLENFEEIIWDTKKVNLEQSLHIVYEGEELKSETRYFYRVKVWGNFLEESDWSEISWFETAFLQQSDWKAKWISHNLEKFDKLKEPVSLFRKEFKVKSTIKSARIYTTSAGLYELQLNGKVVSEDLLLPGWTSYHKRLQYQTYDVTELLAENNAIAVMLADGWFKGDLSWEETRHHYGDKRGVLLQLHVSYEDGTKDIVITDESWKATTGPILYSELYHGEIYDARLEKEGWSSVGFSDANWDSTSEYDFNLNNLIAQENVATRVREILQPIDISTTPKGDTVIDMGQNMVGRMRFKVSVAAGVKIRLSHAEIMDKEGEIYFANLRNAKQIVEYIAKGEGEEEYSPHFTFQGFRYVKVEGIPKDEIQGNFIAEVIHSDMEKTGEFESSNAMVNKLQENICWGQRGNFVDVPTDCPQRDERLGWTGDAQVFIRTALFNYHGGAFFTKWLHDLKADQLPNGGVPFVIPQVVDGDSSSAWGDAAVVCPWVTYLQYNDEQLLREQYPSMKSWIGYIRVQGENEFTWDTGFHFGDWLGLDSREDTYFGATPDSLIATAFYAYSTSLLVKAAKVLNKVEDVKEYTNLYENIKEQFRREYITQNGRLASSTQTAHVLTLMFDLVEADVKERIAKDLNALVLDNDYHLTTGFVGTPYLNLVLSQNGYHDTAVKLLLQKTYPSWLYSVSKGATTIWEHWDGIKEDGSFWNDDMNSYNHYAYGAVGEWMYRILAGLDMDEAAPAYKKIKIKPYITTEEFDFVKASHESEYGTIFSGWKVNAEEVEVTVEIPVNTRATVYLPNAQLADVKESDGALSLAKGINNFVQEGKNVRIMIGSGKYVFTYRSTELFTKEFTADTKLIDLLIDKEATIIAEKYVPGVSNPQSQFAKFKAYPISVFHTFPLSLLSDEVLTAFITELNCN